ncbi:MAG TPA: 5'-nucleotidase C-terminal domain-containing protein [Pyrinomonadaceae bacterium]|nr:5'-nucleotidase C-terminal domain-containing protein [Pyrinomonadaceae bacterium]
MRYAIRLKGCAAAVVFCLLFTAAAVTTQAQQGSAPAPAATPRPAPQAAAPSSAPLDLRVRATESAIDASIPNDPATEAIIAPYSAKVHELDAPIGKLVGQLKKGGMGGGSLGNFVADALRARAEARLGKPVLLAITNSGGLRKNEIAEGSLTSNDIYQLLPFENALVALDLTGEQLRRFLGVVVTHRDAQSGARIAYRTNEKKESEIVTVKLGGGATEAEIDPKAVYTIVTIDYLVKRGGDYSLLQEAKNVHPLGLTMRDAVLEYVKAETAAGRNVKAALDGRFRYEKAGVETKTEDEP